MFLKDKVVVVTGGAGLLGREFCEMIVSNGGVAIIAEYNVVLAEEVRNEIGSDKVYVEKIDITSKDSINNLMKKLHIKFEKIDAIVNSAYPRNKNYGKHFFDVEYDDFCENLGMNLGGYFLSSQLFAK
jgi:NAD(P)-dependent dehydrogenase (short-subunit alcohol dehydrogenase family)